MNNVNKTLYIPLYGKAFVSKKGIILIDKKAEEIWGKVQFPLKGKSKSKWLAYYMSMRSCVFDTWTKEKIKEFPNSIILHLGCGLDSRVVRVGEGSVPWFDVDFPAVIDERKRFFAETDCYSMLASDIQDCSFFEALPKLEHAIVILEGVSMYLTNQKLQQVLSKLTEHFTHVSVLVDCYTPFAVKMSKIKNPIKDVGVSKVYGVASSSVLEIGTGLTFVKELSMTPQRLVDELKGVERKVFKFLYAGKTAKKLYKLYEYKS